MPLIEWPELAENLLPETTLELVISGSGDHRTIEWSTSSEVLEGRIARTIAIRQFLKQAGWDSADRRFLTGDASARQYEMIHQTGQRPYILMDAPAQPDGPPIRNGLPYSHIAHLAEDVRAFVGIAEMLRKNGFAAPEILKSDFAQGLLLISHLGTETPLDAKGHPLDERYIASGQCLAAIHEKAWDNKVEIKDSRGEHITHYVPSYDESAMLIEADLLLDWYLPRVSECIVTEELRGSYHQAWRDVFSHLNASEKSLVLRIFTPPILFGGRQKQAQTVLA